jgi:hypothetical protein
MKLPKSVCIAGKTYKITVDKNSAGGWFGTTSQEIKIGTKGLKDEMVLITFLHEVIEAIFTERNMRYSLRYNNPENGDYLYSFNHDQFENAVQDIACALRRK